MEELVLPVRYTACICGLSDREGCRYVCVVCLSKGTLDVDAVFESGQVINYVGKVLAGMCWYGQLTVTVAGTPHIIACIRHIFTSATRSVFHIHVV